MTIEATLIQKPIVAHHDAAGKNVSVGDYIVYAVASRMSPQLRFGRVIKLKRRQVGRWRSKDVDPNTMPPTLGVIAVDRGWTKASQWELVKEGKETTLGSMNSFIVIDKNHVPNAALELLEEPIP